MKPSHTIRPVFDDPNLVSAAGLVPMLRLAESAGLYDLLEGLSVGSPNPVAKATSWSAGCSPARTRSMTSTCCGTAGWAGCSTVSGRPRRSGRSCVRSPTGTCSSSTRWAGGCWPASQLGCPGLIAGSDPEGIAFLDVDDTIGEVHGYAKQGAAFGYSGVRGLNLQLATISTPLAAPVIARARLRKGNTASATPAPGVCSPRPSPPPAQPASPAQVLCRADSAYYGWAFVGTAIRHQAWFSVTARMNPAVSQGDRQHR